ncbi:MAG: ankyrin repeat domain-containing protein [Desulfovibrionaceae bacterium]|nr:ankyrin repeat domain-containing protein [Desulfovibrionaceae bacterium]
MIKSICSLWLLVLALLFGPYEAQALTYEISAEGQNLEAACSTVRLQAVRQCLLGLISKEQAKNKALEIRKLLFKNLNDLAKVEVLEKEQVGGKVRIKTKVLVDEAKVAKFLGEIEGLTLKPTTDISSPEKRKSNTSSNLRELVQSRVEDLKLNLEQGADPNQTDSLGKSGLFYAVELGSWPHLKLLLEHKANPNLSVAILGQMTPLMLAVVQNRPDLVDLLLKAKAHLDAQNDDGRTALLLALRANFTPMAEKLLEAGANPNLADQKGFSPLAYALSQNNLPVVKLLIAKGANPKDLIPDFRGKCTALEFAKIYGSKELIDYLTSLN